MTAPERHVVRGLNADEAHHDVINVQQQHPKTPPFAATDDSSSRNLPERERLRRMDDDQDIISDWIGREILPHESMIRSWISRRWRNVVDPNDVIQEAYCRIASLDSVDHIHSPVAYFRRTAQTVVTDVMRRSGIINFTSMTEDEWSNVIDNEPLADRALEAGQELERVNGLLSELSDTCRRAIELRRIEGVSQREAAQRLGVSEDVIRNHLVRGMQKILKKIAAQDAELSGDEQETAEQKAEVIGEYRRP